MDIITPELRFRLDQGASADESLELDFSITDPLAVMINGIQSTIRAELTIAAADNVAKRFQIDLDPDVLVLDFTGTKSRSSVLLDRACRYIVNTSTTVGITGLSHSGPDWISWHNLAPGDRPITFRNLRYNSRIDTGSTQALVTFSAIIHYQIVRLTTDERTSILARII